MMNRIKAITLLLCLILAPSLTLAEEFKPIKVIIVRHAEKVDESADPELSEKGVARSEKLALMLEKAGVTKLYSSDYKRTRNTLKPIADKLQLKINTLPASDYDLWKKEILKLQGETVVISGHSNTVDDICRVLAGTKFSDLSTDDYDNLYVICIMSPEKSQFLNLKMGF